MKTLKKALLIVLVLAVCSASIFAQGSSEPKAGKKEVVKIWLGWPALTDVFNRAKVAYEAANPNVEIEITAMNLRDYEQKLAVSLPAGTGPEIFIAADYIVPRYISAGLVATPPAEVTAFVEKNFDSLVKSVNHFKGPEDKEAKIYGFPHIGIARVQ